MQCCHNDDHKHENHDQGHGKKGHSPLMMILCCLIPLILAAIFLSQGYSIGYLMVVLCPLLHIGMMFFLMKNNKAKGDAAK